MFNCICLLATKQHSHSAVDSVSSVDPSPEALKMFFSTPTPHTPFIFLLLFYRCDVLDSFKNDLRSTVKPWCLKVLMYVSWVIKDLCTLRSSCCSCGGGCEGMCFNSWISKWEKKGKKSWTGSIIEIPQKQCQSWTGVHSTQWKRLELLVRYCDDEYKLQNGPIWLFFLYENNYKSSVL